MSEFRLIDIEIDRIDPKPASQVRIKSMEEAVSVYVSRLDQMPPIHLFNKSDGKPGERIDHWLADGNHTLLAYKKAGKKIIKAMIGYGTYADAFRYACQANQNLEDTLKRFGVPVFDGDKRRRIEVWLERPEAKGMAQHQVAEICGVSREYVTVIAKGNNTQDNHASSASPTNGQPATTPRNSAFNQTVRPAIEEALRTAPETSNKAIAESVGCNRQTVARVREDLGIPNPRTAPGKPKQDGQPQAAATVKAVQEKPTPATPEQSSATTAEPKEEESSTEWWSKQKQKIIQEYNTIPPFRRALWIGEMWSLLMELQSQLPGFIDRTKESFG
jgi:hypothetical protein